METIFTLKELIGRPFSLLPDLIVFTGGSDVNPELYGDEKHPYSVVDTERDVKDVEAYEWAKKHNIPCVGICRGGQFLNVMNGGKMYQHIANHGFGHDLITSSGRAVEGVTSTHHQMMIVPRSGKLVAWAEDVAFSGEYEPEVVWFEESRDLSVQYHPEYMGEDSDGYRYFQQLLEEYFNEQT